MSSLMPVVRFLEWRMTTRDWQEFAASGDIMAAIPLANGVLLEIKIDYPLPVLLKVTYITGCCFQMAHHQDGNVMTISLECLLVISGKSLFVKILVNQLLITGKLIYVTFNKYKKNKFRLIKFCDMIGNFVLCLI